VGGVVVLEEPPDELFPDEEVPAEDDPSLVPDEGAGVLHIATGGTAGVVVVVGEVSACAATGSATASTLIAVATAAHL
jgi:hypothetical protein